MAEEYEFTSEDPLRRPRPLRPADEDQEDEGSARRPSSRRYDHEDEDFSDRAPLRRRPTKSGTVTAIGILAICMGALNLLGNGCGLVFVALKEPLTDFMRQAAKNNPGAQNPQFQDLLDSLDRMPIFWLGIMLGLSMLISVMMIFSGIGTLHRKDSSRRVLIMLAVANAALSVLGLVGNVIYMGTEQLSGIIGLIFPLLFAGFTLAVLRNPANLREFE